MTQTSLQRQAPSPAISDKAGASSAQLPDYRVQAREHDAHSSMMQNSARATQFKQMQTLMHQHAAASTASVIPLQEKSAELRKSAKPVLQTKTWLTANVDRSPLVQRKTLAQTGWGEKLGVTETPDTHAIDDYSPFGSDPNAGSHANAKIYEDTVPLKKAKSKSDAMKKLATRAGDFGDELSKFTATINTETKATVLATIAPKGNTAAAAAPATALANTSVARGPAAESKAPAANKATGTGLSPIKLKDNTAAAATPAAALANTNVARGPAVESKAPAANKATRTVLATIEPRDNTAAAAAPAAALANTSVARGPAVKSKAPAPNEATATGLTPKPRDNTAAAATPAAALANTSVARGTAAESKAPAANEATATGLTPKPKDNTAAAAAPAAALANTSVARGPAVKSKAPAPNEATATGLTPKPRDNTAAAATPAAALANTSVARGTAAESKAPAANEATATGLTPKPKDNTAAAAAPAAALANTSVARGPAVKSKAPAANEATATGLTPKPKDNTAAAATPAAPTLANPTVAQGTPPESKETITLAGSFYSISPNRNKHDESRLDPFCHSMTVKLPGNQYIKMLIQHTIGHDGYITKIEEGTKGKNESPDQVKTTATMVNGKAEIINAGSYTYSKTHEKTGTDSLLKMDDPRRFDAMTKLVGEGSRFKWVRENIERITDETEYSINVTDYKKDDTQISIKFKDLWVTWNNWFGGKYNISKADLKSVLQVHWASFKEEKNSKKESIAVGNMFGTTKGEESGGKIKVTKSKNAAPAKK